MSDDTTALLLDLARASGFGLLRGRVLIPTPRLVSIARSALAKAKAIESLEMVPADGEVRLHLVLSMMGSTTRVVVRAAVASFHLGARGGSLRLRLLEAPTFAGKHGGKSAGLMGMLGAFGGAALSSMGPEGIAQTLAEFIGAPLSARADMLCIDLGAIPAVKKAMGQPTAIGRIGDAVQVTGARFRPGGLEVAVRVVPKSMLKGLAVRVLAKTKALTEGK